VRRLLGALGVDYDQWRGLVRALRLFDIFNLRQMRGTPAAVAWKAGKAIGAALLLSLSLGFTAATVIWRSADLLFAGIVLSTHAIVMTLMLILGTPERSLIALDDYYILGFRPITSRTYLAVRVTGLMTQTLLMIALSGIVPISAVVLKYNGSIGMLAAGFADVCVSAVVASLAAISLSTYLLLKSSPEKLKRIASYAQTIVMFLMMAGYFYGIRLLIDETTLSFSLDRSTWLWLYPGSWMASYVAIAAGLSSVSIWAGGFASVALVTALAWNLSSRLSLDYASTLAEASVTPEKPAPILKRARAGRRRFFRRDEARALAVLVRSQFRNNLKFRLGLLSVVPMMAVYFLLGIDTGPPDDPFNPTAHGANNVIFVQMALMFLPSSLRSSLITTTEYRAAWIFHVTPASKVRLVTSGRDIISLYFLLPFLILLATALTYFFGNVLHALVHVFFLGLIAYIVLQLDLLNDPRLPFSRAPVARATGRYGLMTGIMIVGAIVVVVLTRFVYRSTPAMIVTAVFLVGTAWTLDRMTRRRVERREAELHFED
jgi:hypothetical protein